MERDHLLSQQPLIKARVRYRDLRVLDEIQREKILSAVEKIMTSGQILMGPNVDTFERAFAASVNKKYCVAVSSGTSALYLALKAYGIGKGDEVITSPLSWIATRNAIEACGAKAVFVDVKRDMLINVELIENSITKNTKAILPVHFTGRLCDMRSIIDVAKKYGLLIIEDAAQAYGARIDLQYAGSFGDASAFSLNPMKSLSALGEAGAIVTDDLDIYKKLISLRYLGTVDKEVCHFPELNHKVDEIQAAFLLISLDYVEDDIMKRIDQASIYNNYLNGYVEIPSINKIESVFFDYQILAEDRNNLRNYLAEQGIETKVKHPILMFQHPAYEILNRKKFPVASSIIEQSLSLPLHKHLQNSDIGFVCEKIKQFKKNR